MASLAKQMDGTWDDHRLSIKTKGSSRKGNRAGFIPIFSAILGEVSYKQGDSYPDQ